MRQYTQLQTKALKDRQAAAVTLCIWLVERQPEQQPVQINWMSKRFEMQLRTKLNQIVLSEVVTDLNMISILN